MSTTTPEERTNLRTQLERYEGSINHMYLDTRGFVTVAVGHLIVDEQAAQKLDFVYADNQEKASTEVIAEEYRRMKAQEMGMVASRYKAFAELRMEAPAIDTLTDKHIETFDKELGNIYGAEFAGFPSNVRMALFDMIFNLGQTKLRKTYPTFNRYIAAGDWANAATECNRRGISDERNNYVKELLRTA